MPKKEIRFQELVKTSGKPDIVSLWTDPKRDRPFMKAVKENRVLTITQTPASKRKDFGRIGFHQEPHAAYLIFPEPLPAGGASRVIGIKYDLIETPKVKDPVSKKTSASASSKTKSPRQPRAAKKTFNVVIRRIAVIETSIAIRTTSKANAAAQALDRIKREPFDAAKAILRHAISSVQ